MAKKVSDSQIAGIKAHAEAKNKATIDKVNKAIDKLKRKRKPINFETVCKEAGVSRATLYNNPQLKERILSLRAIMQNMYKYTNYIFCINCVLHVNHTLFYRKFKNIKRYTEHLL